DTDLFHIRPKCLIHRHGHKSAFQHAGAIFRNIGRRHEGQRHEERKLGKLKEREVVWIGDEFAGNWYFGSVREAFGAAEREQWTQLAVLPKFRAADHDRADIDDLAVDFSALHRQPNLSGA